MRFAFAVALAALSIVATPALAAQKSKPSSVPSTGFLCPEAAANGKPQIPDLCDTPPHSNSMFGCTFRGNTSSTSTLKCVYDVLTGECTSAEEDCPKSALDLSKRSISKRSTIPAPPVPVARKMHRSSNRL
ncbi:hypothetical protein DFH05DRAFT_1458342 [Lentinula detonsa]|uniref:Uncharacterized protein n=2 Tax=Lentinula TaxID=5352 RepID=A0A9W8P6W9_9AGAR|nr:hypothetical protein DFH05DRAFT_1458342 [Lentinula detonsa]KAJ3781975.1 hypothetical protein GGU10DRAFT_365003 [Lentinula aff. detonsa]KAJ3981188.1 hypothetical protein F5890DRAFT_1477143 [Lentinula detonsa]